MNIKIIRFLRSHIKAVNLFLIALSIFVAFVIGTVLGNDDWVDQDKAIAAEPYLISINNLFVLLIGIFCIIYYFICGAKGGFKMRLLWVWLAVGGYCVLRFLLVFFSLHIFGFHALPVWLFYALRWFFLSAFVMFLAIELCVLLNCRRTAPSSIPHIIVLGAKTGSPILAARVDTAADYLRESPSAVAIVSGGQGADEPESEAAWMRARLISAGIPDTRIIPEDKSVSTFQNMRFSAALFMPAASGIAIVTDDFHMFRARCIARLFFRCPIYTLPAHTAHWTLPHYMVCEYFSTILRLLKGELGVF